LGKVNDRTTCARNATTHTGQYVAEKGPPGLGSSIQAWLIRTLWHTQHLTFMVILLNLEMGQIRDIHEIAEISNLRLDAY